MDRFDIQEILHTYGIEPEENLSRALEEIINKISEETADKLLSDRNFMNRVSQNVSEQLAREASSSRSWRTF